MVHEVSVAAKLSGRREMPCPVLKSPLEPRCPIGCRSATGSVSKLGTKSDPLGALARMAGFIEHAAHQRGIAEALGMTVAVSDGKSIWAVRYASDGDAPTLYHSRDMSDVYQLNPQLIDRLSAMTRLVVSEPLGTIADAWKMVPQNSSIRVTGAEIEVQPFAPVAPDFLAWRPRFPNAPQRRGFNGREIHLASQQHV
jgi:hypothetical protein